MYKYLKELFRTICYGEMLIPATEREQGIFDDKIEELKKYRPRTKDNIDTKNNLLTNAQNFYDGREMIINVFKNTLFPFYSGNYYEEFKEESSESEDEDKIPDISTLEQMARLDKIYVPLTSRNFMEKSLTVIMNKLKNYKENPEKLQMYDNLMVRLNIGLERIESDIKNMSEDKVEKKKHLDYLKNLVRAIVDAGQKYDMPDLETEEEAEAGKRQKGQGLKIMTPKQMITRFPILLAQLKARNNSQKIKNEIRQIVYSLYRSKNLSKTIYNSLMNTI